MLVRSTTCGTVLVTTTVFVTTCTTGALVHVTSFLYARSKVEHPLKPLTANIAATTITAAPHHTPRFVCFIFCFSVESTRVHPGTAPESLCCCPGTPRAWHWWRSARPRRRAGSLGSTLATAYDRRAAARAASRSSAPPRHQTFRSPPGWR